MEKLGIFNQLEIVNQQAPIVHSITNLVVMNTTANALLAIGASPIMAHAQEEIVEIIGISNALVINIGTLSNTWAEVMVVAAQTANEKQRPWVLDPVGAGISAFRNASLQRLLNLKPTVIRANASEIQALADFNLSNTKGVDSASRSDEALTAAKILNKTYGSIVCISGEVDYIVSHNTIVEVHNGHAMQTKVTGMGCTATAMIAAFLGTGNNYQQQAVAAVAILSLAGELAAGIAKGPGTLQLHLYDVLYNLSKADIIDNLNLVHYAY
ncbi:hydroxyethylthiazole kinase [Sphingobacterium sp. Mn56C]|uniref:hydroxyethylthiazole kinase n=1 Tax=Sphingobacterium sp. Mn56C TaxID=3395261 RepID=UPI003BBF2DA8